MTDKKLGDFFTKLAIIIMAIVIIAVIISVMWYLVSVFYLEIEKMHKTALIVVSGLIH